MLLQRHDHYHNTIFGQVLSIPQNDISYISHTQAIYQNRARVYMIHYFRAVSAQLQHISRGEDENIFLFDPKTVGQICLCFQMTVFAMYRNRVFRPDQRINQFNFLLTGMTGYMRVLENDVCSLHGELIDHSGYRFLISRNRL